MEKIFVNVSSKDDSLEAFLDILPKDYQEKKNTIAIGCCDEEGYVKGVVVYRENFKECAIIWLYVYEEYRRQGIGSALINEILKNHADCYGMKRIYTQIVVSYLNEESNLSVYFDYMISSIESFFDSDIRFDKYQISKVYDISYEEIKTSAVCMRIASKMTKDLRGELFFELSESEKKDILRKLEKHGYEVKDYEEWQQNCLKKLCLCRRDKGKMLALIICAIGENNNVEVQLVYSKNQQSLRELIVYAASVIKEEFNGYSFTIPVTDGIEDALVKYIFTGAEPIYETVEYRWNYDLGLSDEEIEAWTI